jgi:anti-sigma regulatory factor (Ser/Thr protein kinase)
MTSDTTRNHVSRITNHKSQMADTAQNFAPVPPPADRIELKISSDPANLAPTRHALEQWCRSRGFDSAAADDVGLCLTEALANVMRHAYGGRTDRPIVITAQCPDQTLIVRVRDWGNGIDPESVPPARSDPLEPGGVGMICLRKLMDSVTFTPQPDGMLLTMTRRRDRQTRQT